MGAHELSLEGRVAIITGSSGGIGSKLALGFAYFIMVVTLIVRPWGLLGKPIKI